MNYIKTEFEYKFEEEIINLNTTTMVRLFSLHNDAVLLYIFYVKTAKIQKYNPVFANAKFCQNGLGWGSKRFKIAKKILKDEGLIRDIVRKDENGKIIGHYVKIEYFRPHVTSGVVHHPVDEATQWTKPPSGDQPTNTNNKKGNTIDEKGNTIDEKEKDTLSSSGELDDDKSDKNTYFSEEAIRLTSEWSEHKHLPQYNKITKDTSVSINDINITVDRALKLVTEPELIQAIRNYSEVIKNPEKYYFSFKWKFEPFLARGTSAQGRREGKGFWQFMDDADPLNNFQRFKKAEHKATKTDLYLFKYDKIFDKANGLYMGMGIEEIQSRDFKEYLWDLKNKHKRKKLEFRHFKWIEEGLIGSIYHKDEQMYKEYKKLHNIYKLAYSKELGGVV